MIPILITIIGLLILVLLAYYLGVEMTKEDVRQMILDHWSLYYHDPDPTRPYEQPKYSKIEALEDLLDEMRHRWNQ